MTPTNYKILSVTMTSALFSAISKNHWRPAGTEVANPPLEPLPKEGSMRPRRGVHPPAVGFPRFRPWRFFQVPGVNDKGREALRTREHPWETLHVVKTMVLVNHGSLKGSQKHLGFT